MRMQAMTAAIVGGIAAASFTATAAADLVTLGINLDGSGDNTLRLTGQSAAFFNIGSGTSSGGQLDGVQSGGTVITYTEVFPPPDLTGYHTFGYFGRVETIDADENVLDTSFIMAFQPGNGVGARISDYFIHTEATLVAALAGFDTPEFFDILNNAPGNPLTIGAIAVPPIGQTGETLDLVAFIGGPDGDIGVKVGEYTCTVVPAPASVAVLVFGLLAPRRRR